MSGSRDKQRNLRLALSVNPDDGTRRRKTLTQEVVRDLLDYDPETGVLRWKKEVSSYSRRPPGAVAGGTRVKGSGYVELMIYYRVYKAHRIIWLWWYGYFPEHHVDHINRDRTDNRLANLREVSPQCNSRNSSVRKDSKTGITGVVWDIQSRKWKAVIRTPQKYKTVGLFKDFDAAVKARHQAEVELEWPGCNSSTPAYLYLTKKGAVSCQQD